jgi:hypothetical protein
MFFRTLPTANRQHWLLVAIIVLMLVGFNAIRKQELLSGGGFSSVSTPDGAGPSPDISMTWRPALTAASEIVLNWLVLSVFLVIVSLSRSTRPQFGQNLRVAIWTSLPLGLMAALQLVFYSSGGKPGKAGLSGIIPEIAGFSNLPSFSQMLLLSLGAQLTVFWLWSLILIYLGARYALGGLRTVVVFVIALWIAWLVLLPAAASSFTTTNAEPLPTLVPFPEASQSP